MSKTEREEGIPTEELRKANASPVEFAERLLPAGGAPMDFSGEYQYWKEPLEAAADPETPRIHLWVYARGLGKTEDAGIIYVYTPVTNAMTDIMYGVPRSDQLSSFMKGKVRRKVRNSRDAEGKPPFLLTCLDDNDVTVKRNQFDNGSIAEARTAWGTGEALQGFHGSMGIADEAGNWTQEALANLRNAIDEPLGDGAPEGQGDGRIILTGTPTFEGTVYHEYYEESDKREYFFNCPACGERQTTTLKNVEQVSVEPRDWELVCRYCSEPLGGASYIIENGDWEPTNPDGVHRSYRLGRLESPRHELNEVMRDYERPSTSKQQFYNFQLARFYSGASKPIPPQAIQMAANTERMIRDYARDGVAHYVGVDFGGGESSETVVCVIHTTGEAGATGGLHPSGIILDTVERIDYETRAEELRKVADVLSRFRIEDRGRAVMDLGYGSAHVSAFQNGDTRDNTIPEYGYGSRVLGHRFGNINKEQDGRYKYLKHEGRQIKAYKPAWANHVIELFPDIQGFDAPDDELDYTQPRTADTRIDIPYYKPEDGKTDHAETRRRIDWFKDHLTAVKREYKESDETGKKKEYFTTFTEQQKDDGFMSLVYAYTAAVVGGGASSAGGSGDVDVNVGGSTL